MKSGIRAPKDGWGKIEGMDSPVGNTIGGLDAFADSMNNEFEVQ